jgi:hypothetical protein
MVPDMLQPARPDQSDKHPACWCGWGDRCTQIQADLQEANDPLAGFIRMRQPNADSKGLPATKKRAFIDHMNHHCRVTMETKGRINVAKHHWHPSVHEFLQEKENVNKDISHVCHFPTIVAWESANKVDIFDRHITPKKPPNESVLQETMNQNRSSSNAPSIKKKKERGFSVFLTPNFTEANATRISSY